MPQHACRCPTYMKRKQREFKAVQRAWSWSLLEEHKAATAEMIWLGKEGSARLVRCQP